MSKRENYAVLLAGFWSNPKVLLAGNEAVGLYARALSYCAEHLTDGFVPREVAAFLAATPPVAEPAAAAAGSMGEPIGSRIGSPIDSRSNLDGCLALVSSGLWEKVRKGSRRVVRTYSGEDLEVVFAGFGFFIPDYVFFNGSKAEILAVQAKKSEAGREAANRRWHGSANGSPIGSTHAKPSAGGIGKPNANPRARATYAHDHDQGSPISKSLPPRPPGMPRAPVVCPQCRTAQDHRPDASVIPNEEIEGHIYRHLTLVHAWEEERASDVAGKLVRDAIG